MNSLSHRRCQSKFKLTGVFVVIAVFSSACNTTDHKEPVEYKGPLSEFENVELYYSENARVKVKMTADLLYEYQNGDKEFPKGVHMEFYDLTGKLENTLRANHAYYVKTEDHWRGRGNVEVKNLIRDEQLNTEELFWSPKDRKIFTEKFVTIRLESDVLYGEGLTANEDLSEYVITKPSGDMSVKE